MDASSDEGPSSVETRKGKDGKCEKSKGKGKDGKLEKGKGTVLREQFCNNDEDTSDASTLSSAPTRDPEAVVVLQDGGVPGTYPVALRGF